MENVADLTKREGENKEGFVRIRYESGLRFENQIFRVCQTT